MRGWIERDFEISEVPSRGNTLNVTQFHFTDWPDRGGCRATLVNDLFVIHFADVPESPEVFLRFLRRVKKTHDSKELSTDGNSPIVAHCSAGVGRTGFFFCFIQG